MAKRLSFKRASLISMPRLKPVAADDKVVKESRKERVSSVLTQIEIVSCFRDDEEPLL